jgi:hypothetical protein
VIKRLFLALEKKPVKKSFPLFIEQIVFFCRTERVVKEINKSLSLPAAKRVVKVVHKSISRPFSKQVQKLMIFQF